MQKRVYAFLHFVMYSFNNYLPSAYNAQSNRLASVGDTEKSQPQTSLQKPSSSRENKAWTEIALLLCRKWVMRDTQTDMAIQRKRIINLEGKRAALGRSK